MTPLALALPDVPPVSAGTWSSVAGTRCGVDRAGIARGARDDVVVLVAPGTAAGLTTRSTAAAAPCRWTRARLPGRAHAVVVNAGNANAATGRAGDEAVRATAIAAARALGCEPDHVLVCSTGVIGVPLPVDRLLPAVERACRSTGDAGVRAARAILTTDTAAKEAACELDGVRVAGMAKGSGMIHPDMATMLAFAVTDARVEAAALQEIVARVAARTFHCVSVDGDTSTNDTLIVQATGAGRDASSGPARAALERALESVCRSLAQAIARDGEGATCLVEVVLRGTPGDAQAREAARAVVRSPLVKSAIRGRDPNWGRVLGALGAARAGGLDDIDLDFAGVPVVRGGAPVDFDEGACSEALGAPIVSIHARLDGPGLGWAWGCDLTEEYVKINGSYRT